MRFFQGLIVRRIKTKNRPETSMIPGGADVDEGGIQIN
jgi:hypothetical protein